MLALKTQALGKVGVGEVAQIALPIELDSATLEKTVR